MLWNKYELGDFVSLYKFIFRNPSLFTSVYEREVSHLHFHGGTVFLDSENGIILIENQVFLGTGGTVMANIFFG